MMVLAESAVATYAATRVRPSVTEWITPTTLFGAGIGCALAFGIVSNIDTSTRDRRVHLSLLWGYFDSKN
jgi:hypothetical protein